MWPRSHQSLLPAPQEDRQDLLLSHITSHSCHSHILETPIRSLSQGTFIPHSVILSHKVKAIFSFLLYISNLHKVALEMKNTTFKMTNTEHRTFTTTKKSPLFLWRNIIHSLIDAPTFSPGSFTNSHALPALNFAFQSRH